MQALYIRNFMVKALVKIAILLVFHVERNSLRRRQLKRSFAELNTLLIFDSVGGLSGLSAC
jgi:hypothetical protein